MGRRAGSLVTRTVLAAILISVVIPSSASSATTSLAAPIPRFVKADCPIEFPRDVAVDCGYLIVLENRRQPAEGTIRLAVAILRAPSRHPKPDPILFLMGGPSYPAIDEFGFSLAYFGGAAYTEDRDVILLDQRGVGSSRPYLGCPEYDRLDQRTFPQGATLQEALAATRACHDRLTSRGVDLKSYDYNQTAADVRDLRMAMGIDSWNILALSAGTFFVHVVMRLYPEGIRSVIMDAPLSPKLNTARYFLGVDATLDRMFWGCTADAECREAHPHLRARFFRLVHRLRAHPEKVTVQIRGDGTFSARIDGNILLMDMAGCASAPQFGCTQTVPDQMEFALHGGLQEMYGGPIDPPVPFAHIIAEAKNLSYQCRNQSAFVTEQDLRRAAREQPEYAELILGERGFFRFCRIWHVGRGPESSIRYVNSDIPTLVLAGAYDGRSGGTPVDARQTANHLDRAFLHVFPGLGHITLLHDCPRRITTQFINAPRAEQDSSCMARMPIVDFSPGQAATHAAGPSPEWRGIPEAGTRHGRGFGLHPYPDSVSR